MYIGDVSVSNILTTSQSGLSLIFNVLAHLVLLPVSCNVSCLKHINGVSVLSCLRLILNVSARCVSTPALSWQVSLSRKIRLDSVNGFTFISIMYWQLFCSGPRCTWLWYTSVRSSHLHRASSTCAVWCFLIMSRFCACKSHKSAYSDLQWSVHAVMSAGVAEYCDVPAPCQTGPG